MSYPQVCSKDAVKNTPISHVQKYSEPKDELLADINEQPKLINQRQRRKKLKYKNAREVFSIYH